MPELSDKYLISQTQVTAALVKAKCCYASYQQSILNALKGGIEMCANDKKAMTQLSASIFALTNYSKSEKVINNCISDNEAYKHIENINKWCGCANC